MDCNSLLDDRPEAGSNYTIDFLYGRRYGSPLNRDTKQLDKCSGLLRQQLEEAGQKFWNAIPEEIRNGTLYSVDGVITEDDQILWLEMNSNPMFPVSGYSTMLDWLFGLR